MKSNSKHMGQVLGYWAIFGAIFVSSHETHAFSNLSMGLNLNYGSGGYAGAPMFGYGAAGASFGALNGCIGGPGGIGGIGGGFGGGFGGGIGGGFGGGFGAPGLPPPPRIVPPHLQGGGFLGAGMMGSPYLQGGIGGGIGGCAMYCQPVMPYAHNQGQIMGSMNAPILASQGGASAGANGVYSIAGGGTTVIDMRTTEVDNTGDIIWAAALGMGMQAPNSYPVMIPRNNRTVLDPFYYQEGPRDWALQPRPHAQ